jgi:GrpB-like predicted nucleotidyltransferase (UPF0157 family)
MKSDVGLEHGRVRVAPHSDHWSDVFEHERKLLAEGLGGLVLDIQHVGSTAVPDLTAKPIIDIAVAIANDSLAEPVSERLAELNYKFADDAGSDGGLIFYRETNPPVRTHHVHVVCIDNAQWRNYLGFRDRLRNDAELANEYAELKQRLADEFIDDRVSYTAAKAEFVTKVLSEL